MTSILWQRLDGTGLDRATLRPDAEGFRLAGTALIAASAGSFDIRYSVLVDAEWQTRVAAAHLQGPDGERRLSLRVAEDGWWSMGDQVLQQLLGAVDVDFAFTPATATLPIKRLELGVGDSATVQVARVAFPERSIELVSQTYERTGATTYRLSVGDSTTDITVNGHGLVTEYPSLWQVV